MAERNFSEIKLRVSFDRLALVAPILIVVFITEGLCRINGERNHRAAADA